eukprot:Nk52_evm62s32 gene=Nk52_evmTU62s32
MTEEADTAMAGGDDASAMNRQKFKLMKKKVKFLCYEQEALSEELKKAKKKILRLTKEQNFLLDRLLKYDGAGLEHIPAVDGWNMAREMPAPPSPASATAAAAAKTGVSLKRRRFANGGYQSSSQKKEKTSPKGEIVNGKTDKMDVDEPSTKKKNSTSTPTTDNNTPTTTNNNTNSNTTPADTPATPTTTSKTPDKTSTRSSNTGAAPRAALTWEQKKKRKILAEDKKWLEGDVTESSSNLCGARWCKFRSLEGKRYCWKHIPQDPASDYKYCEWSTDTEACDFPVRKDSDNTWCNLHLKTKKKLTGV